MDKVCAGMTSPVNHPGGSPHASVRIRTTCTFPTSRVAHLQLLPRRENKHIVLYKVDSIEFRSLPSITPARYRPTRTSTTRQLGTVHLFTKTRCLVPAFPKRNSVADCAEAGTRDRGCKQRIPGRGWVPETDGSNRFAMSERIAGAIWREITTVAAMGREEKSRRRALRAKVCHVNT